MIEEQNQIRGAKFNEGFCSSKSQGRKIEERDNFEPAGILASSLSPKGMRHYQTKDNNTILKQAALSIDSKLKTLNLMRMDRTKRAYKFTS